MILYNYASLVLHKVLPMNVYILFPYMSLTMIVAVDVIMQQMVPTAETSKKLVSHWADLAKNRSWMKRVVKSLPIIGIEGGLRGLKMFVVGKDAKSMFLQTNLDYTINAVLSL